MENPGIPNPANPEVCPHRIASPDAWVWLPTARRGLAARHAWCTRCGQVRTVGSEQALPMGGLVNVLAGLERRLRGHGIRITEAQRRLIVRRLQAHEMQDPFGHTREWQLDRLAETVGSYVGVSPAVVQTYLRAP